MSLPVFSPRRSISGLMNLSIDAWRACSSIRFEEESLTVHQPIYQPDSEFGRACEPAGAIHELPRPRPAASDFSMPELSRHLLEKSKESDPFDLAQI
jgi:hypothetical protein